MQWKYEDLRLTGAQAGFLSRRSSSVHRRVDERTELILKQRGMFGPWLRNPDGTYQQGLSAKGKAALARWNEKRRART